MSSRAALPHRPEPTDADVAGLVTEAEVLVAAETGLRPPTPAQLQVIDRPQWIRANLASFRRLLAPAVAQWMEQLDHRRAGARLRGLGPASKLAAVELGAILGWMSSRVLGQYDLLVSGEAATDVGEGAPSPDAVYLVAPNLAMLEQTFGFDPDQFRFWVTLHELTHRAQFRGVPWMHDHYLGLIRSALAAVNPDPVHLVESLRTALRDPRAARARIDEGGALALVATAEQRAALDRIGGLMSLLEGHGDRTMDRAAGPGRLPEAPRFARVLRERRKRAGGVARVFQRLIGFEAKLDQYAAGARFLEAIETVEGPTAIERCWQTPDHLPTLEEIRDPGRWLQRVAW